MNKYETQVQTNRHRSSFYFKEHIPIFTKSLYEQGFSQLTIEGYISSIAHFETWLEKKNIALENITLDTVSVFATHRCYCPGRRKPNKISQKYINRVQRFIEYLDQNNFIDIQSQTAPVAHLTPAVQLFKESLQARGLSPATVYNYVHSVSKLMPALGDNSMQYKAKFVKKVITNHLKACGFAESKHITVALRSYLRFLAAEGKCQTSLDRAVPTIAHWRLSSMPRYITTQEVDRVINSCATNTKHGLRDRAILLLLARLGLRAGDIVAMQLDDICWSESYLRLKGKGNREDMLPLPQDVGDAILKYIEMGRPVVAVQKIFLCLNAPYRPFASSPTVSSIVDAALNRAGISNPPTRGAHLLRHSAATDMLRSGATLETISSVLRHRSLDMTAYYAKVDIPMLEKITQPWPESEL